MSATIGTCLLKASFVGGTANGAVSVPGLKAGDVVLTGTFTGGTTTTPTDWSPFSSSFEKVISTDDEIQQNTSSNSDLSTVTFVLYLLRNL